MAKLHHLGFPRIGDKRQLKFALEKFWRSEIDESELQKTAATLREQNWKNQQDLNLDLFTVGDFSLYDQVLDTSVLLGNLPNRVTRLNDNNALNNYFRVARGRAQQSSDSQSQGNVAAGEMTKWFNTNYHYIVPEFKQNTQFSLHVDNLLKQIAELKQITADVKPVVIGPLTYLWLGKEKDDSNKLALLPQLLEVYQELFSKLAEQGISWLQIDEPILALQLDKQWQQVFRDSYEKFANNPIKLLLTTYFGDLQDNLALACSLPVAGLHLDAINAKHEVEKALTLLDKQQILSLGVINGCNIWKTDLNKTLKWLQPLHQQLQDRLWLAPSSSLLHVPVDLDSERKLNSEIQSWLAFAKQKLQELSILGQALNQGLQSVQQALLDNQSAITSRQQSTLVHNPQVKEQVQNVDDNLGNRQSHFEQRAQVQQTQLNLPCFPTTTIGSFPQTAEIRAARQQKRQGNITEQQYQQQMQQAIALCIKEQEALGLDVFVHGEAERNDMVEYFGEQLSGYAFSEFGWVQSYGSRCVKPPILFGDVQRTQDMTVDWINYAQSLTKKPVKGMLTGPVTILNWSFVRDDQPLSETCLQLALAIREEVQALEKSGVNIIQIDEAALREKMPLRRSEWSEYLDWAIQAFRISANGVQDTTQIHTHMCYSEFNEIIAAIADMDADVITIETSRSDMELLDAFENFNYPNAIGPGVYDIHSPNIPEVANMVELMKKATLRIKPEQLWVNPDCGLKTRNWPEVKAALKNMVSAAEQLRNEPTI